MLPDPFQKQPKMNVTTERLKSNLHSLHFTESSPSQKKLPLNDDQLKESAKSGHCRFDYRHAVKLNNIKVFFTKSVEVAGRKDQFEDLEAKRS